ncbi:DUF5995 family protein [Rhodococcus maanshanensis]|uniref:Uncharacterized protein n=1 Tax=Rhodococcus maanshanensis TaxID=183556 RepID=A0A1H7QDA4_9NOCA|nr:DUF5995 family protein [Rhodococcus maanshanensis]SEL45634.1 hypothetical protein SAMN05444583_109120 [Rhodococcus maanshanensis]
MSLRRTTARTSVSRLAALSSITLLASIALAQPAAADPLPASACGTPLSAAEAGTVAALSDTSTITATASMDRLEEEVVRQQRISDILVSHGDRRGLFGIGLDAVVQRAVMPLQRDSAAFVTPEWAHAISTDLLRRYLDNVHAEFTGAPTEPAWGRYFALSRDCTMSPARVAMIGYNAHLTVDLARAVATTGTTERNVADYYKIVDSIATDGDTIVTRTNAAYGADLGPLWRFYFLGEGLDRLAGEGVASELLLRAADSGYNTLTLANGFALQNPQTAPAATAEMEALWATADGAIELLTRLGGL